MTFPRDNWRPSPELLAAYFDGECEGRDDLSLLKQRIEDWLAAHPEAQMELASHRRLRHLWHQTAPIEPRPEKWASMFAQLQAAVPVRKVSKTAARKQAGFSGRRLATLSASLAATVAGLVLYLGWHARQVNQQAVIAQNPIVEVAPSSLGDKTPPQNFEDDDEVLQVAKASEVTIVRVEGADTHTLVVGELPLQGNMELAAPGDIILTKILADPKNNELNPVRLIQGSSPMIWAKLETETDD